MCGDASPGRLGRFGLLGLLALGVGAAGVGGCTARPTHRIDASAARPPVRREGWVRLGSDVRLRDDTPPLAEVLPPDEPAPAAGDFGPRGASGDGSSYPDAGGYGYGYGFGYTPFLAPGGAVPPDLRVPTDARPVSPYAAPYRAAFPGADVTAHRPGLSTGSGVWGRQDDTRPPLPPPASPPQMPRR